MKRTLFIVLFLILIPSFVFAAGTVSQRNSPIKTDFGATIGWELTFTCTGDAANGTIPDGSNSETKVEPDILAELSGAYLYRVIITNTSAQADVTDDSDVYFKTEEGTDLLNGQGVDRLDKDAENYIRLTNYPVMVGDFGTCYIDVDNNSGASSVYTITLIFIY